MLKPCTSPSRSQAPGQPGNPPEPCARKQLPSPRDGHALGQERCMQGSSPSTPTGTHSAPLQRLPVAVLLAEGKGRNTRSWWSQHGHSDRLGIDHLLGCTWRGFSHRYPHREGNNSDAKDIWASPSPTGWYKVGPSTIRFLWGRRGGNLDCGMNSFCIPKTPRLFFFYRGVQQHRQLGVQLGYGPAEDAASTGLVSVAETGGTSWKKPEAPHRRRQTQACTLGDEQAVERQRRGGGKTRER